MIWANLNNLSSTTYLYVSVDGEKIKPFPIQNIPGGDHAEERFVNNDPKLEKGLGTVIYDAKRKFANKKEKTKLSMALNRTTCGKGGKQHDCTTVLMNALKEHKAYFDLDFSFAAEYRPSGEQDKEKFESQMMQLLDLGAKLSATNIWLHIYKDYCDRNKRSMKQEDFLENKYVKNALAEVELDRLIKEITQKYEQSKQISHVKKGR